MFLHRVLWHPPTRFRNNLNFTPVFTLQYRPESLPSNLIGRNLLRYANSIFTKTRKGREEIVTRKHGLALRPLLMMIDGQYSTTSLLEKVSALGLDERSIEKLLEDGYIQSAEKS